MNKIYKYDIETKEFIQELEINEAYGTNLPFTATVKPLAKKDGFAVCFNGTKWEYVEDNRNKTVYSKETKQELKVDYLETIKNEHTLLVPEQFDKWEYSLNKWVEDLIEKETFEEQAKINEANHYLKETDWVETYKLRHDLNPENIPEDSNKWEIINKREEYKVFLKEI